MLAERQRSYCISRKLGAAAPVLQMRCDLGRRELSSYILFQLSELGSRNEHHLFEDICRMHARARVCERILPATGPVAGGGDQGRDFESMPAAEGRSAGDQPLVFRGVVDEPGGEVAFACTIQQSGLSGKVKRDVGRILSVGRRPNRIIFYCSKPMPVGSRNGLKQWAMEEHSIRLDIVDGLALSEDLATPKLFWVAVEYLHVAAEKAPSSAGEVPDWYRSALERWRDGASPPALTVGAFLEVRAAARAFLDEPDLVADLSVWLRALASLANDSDLTEFVRESAQYERICVSVRGRGTLAGLETEVRSFLQRACESGDVDRLRLAGIVFKYLVGANQRGAVAATSAELERWHGEVVNALGRATSGASAGARAVAHAQLGHLAVFWPRNGQIQPDARLAVEELGRALTLSRRVPLFPVDEVAVVLEVASHLLCDEPGYWELVERCDAMTATVRGNAASAERSLDRAVALWKGGRPLLAVRALHEAKVRWYGPDTVRGSIMAMRTLAAIYAQLGCHSASRYYAFAAATAAVQPGPSEHVDLASSSLAMSALSYFFEQCPRSVVRFGMLTAWAHLELNPEPESLERYPLVSDALRGVAAALEWAGREAPGVRLRWSELVESHPAREVVVQAEAAISAAEPDDRLGCARDFGSRDRKWSWEGLGIRWTVSSAETPEAVALAEGFAAALQIVCVDIAPDDWELVGGEVQVRVAVAADGSSANGVRFDERDGRWVLSAPLEMLRGGVNVAQRLALWAVVLVSQQSLAPDMDELLERRFREGLNDKTLSVRTYPRMYLDYVGATAAPQLAPQRGSSCGADCGVLASQLARRRGLSPRYPSAEDLRTMLERRYEMGMLSAGPVLTQLLASMETREKIERLRAQGWLGWQVLAAIGMVRLSWMAERRYGPRWALSRDGREFVQRGMFEAEVKGDSSVPLSIFSEDRLRMQMETNAVSSLGAFELVYRRDGPVDIEQVLAHLRERFRFFEDEIPELDPFSVGARVAP